MKIGILTFVNTSNYGASLQAYALQQAIQKKGAECDILNYSCDKISRSHDPKKASKRNGIKKLATPLLYYVYKKRLEEFHSFEQEHCTFSEPCDKNSIASVVDMYDRIVVGSDQVWNTPLTGNDRSFFLDLPIDPSKKYSYACSIGTPYFSPDETGSCEESLVKFRNISFRENEAYDTFCSNNVFDGRLSCDSDPTFLMYGQWDKFVTSSPSQKDYIFMYFVPEAPELMEKIRSFAKEKNCKIILLKKGVGLRKGIKVVNTASPSEFINYIAHAKYVISGSFHALAFSLMLGTQFYATAPPNKERIVRITSLLSRFGLSDRLLTLPDCNMVQEQIDFNTVKDKIEEWKTQSMETIDFITSEEKTG